MPQRLDLLRTVRLPSIVNLTVRIISVSYTHLDVYKRQERKKAEQELKKVKENLDKSQENAVQSMISLCQRLGGTKEQAIEELQGNYGQTEEQAKEKIKTYWKE